MKKNTTKLLLCILPLLLSQLTADAQAQKKHKTPAPPPITLRDKPITKDKDGKKLSAIGILLFNMQASGFRWAAADGTVVPKDSLFRKSIYLFDGFMARVDEDRVGALLPMEDQIIYAKQGTLQWYQVRMSGDTLILNADAGDGIERYQVVLNKAKNKIMHLKSLKDGHIFTPLKYIPPPPPPSMPRP